MNSSGIDRDAALRLRSVVDRFADGHSAWDYEAVTRAIHDAGFSTVLFPLYDDHKRPNGQSPMRYYWAMIDPAADEEFALASASCGHGGVWSANPVYCMESLRPLADVAGELVTMDLRKPGYITGVRGLRTLLAQQTRRSDASGRGTAAAENHRFWRQDFDKRWPEGSQLVLRPEVEIAPYRMRFTRVPVSPPPSADKPLAA